MNDDMQKIGNKSLIMTSYCHIVEINRIESGKRQKEILEELTSKMDEYRVFANSAHVYIEYKHKIVDMSQKEIMEKSN
jgi:hypothetical protein